MIQVQGNLLFGAFQKDNDVLTPHEASCSVLNMEKCVHAQTRPLNAEVVVQHEALTQTLTPTVLKLNSSRVCYYRLQITNNLCQQQVAPVLWLPTGN